MHLFHQFLSASYAAVLTAKNPEALGRWEEISVGGVKRGFLVYAPPGREREPLPLLLVFHGLASNARQMAVYSQFNQLADAHGFIVAYGEGLDRMWRVPGFLKSSRLTAQDEVAYVRRMVERVCLKHAVQRDAIYAAGFSNGGFLAFYLAEAMNAELAGIASVSGAFTSTLSKGYQLPRPISALIVHGTLDPVVNYDGIGGLGMIPRICSVEEGAGVFIEANGCSLIPTVEELPKGDARDGCRAILMTFPGVADVQVLKIENGGHTWPGAPLPAALRRRLGRVSTDIDASDMIWRFFVAQRKARALQV